MPNQISPDSASSSNIASADVNLLPHSSGDKVIGRETASRSFFRSRGDSSRANRRFRRRSLPKNFFLKRLDAQYWKRLLRYLYVRFVRLQSSPRAIARGVAVGVFAGSFPLLGFQSLIGIMLAALVGGNKVMAVASTWISNPLTYFPLFALNFHIGRWLLRLPITTMLPSSPTDWDEWMAMGLDVGAALMLGSCVVGIVAAAVGYYVGLIIARRVHIARVARGRSRR
ncbi:MAG: DUF2062 domain-containing protein [Phormidesmis sp.]